MKTINLLFLCFVVLSLGSHAQTVTDVDGNVYKTVTIGKQIWMAENLKVKHYRNRKAIPLVTNNTAWNALTTPAYCYYNNDTSNIAIYGCLYNWYAVIDSNNICPKGWHIPSDSEWMELVTYLGGSSVAGGKMKETGTKHWADPNEGATNESRFAGLPGGLRGNGGAFWSGDINGGLCGWWDSAADGNKTYGWMVRYSNAKITRSQSHSNANGFSIRCIKNK
ncbi:MAG: fibrobacter succinogenes major paralogous domain-containing protein [Bacteroidota bacterium]|jgi:uncharacterized protein (TIGR02145 family)